jgi:hypothetical protein
MVEVNTKWKRWTMKNDSTRIVRVIRANREGTVTFCDDVATVQTWTLPYHDFIHDYMPITNE